MLLRTASLALFSLASALTAQAAGDAKHAHAPEGGWPFEGVFGQFDQDSLQRGYQVYREVCAACHSMDLMSYRNLGEKGGPFYDPSYSGNENPLVRAFAAEDEVYGGVDEVGEPIYRAATPADRFRAPYANDNAARAANMGALPPDLSVITKARHGGASYVYSLLSGYPEGFVDNQLTFPLNSDGHSEGEDAAKKGKYKGVLTQPVGQYYNPYMSGDATGQWAGDPRYVPPGGFLAMAPQLPDGRVEYMDGTEATTEQMSADVAQFLAWAGEPKQDNRKSGGLKVMAFLFILAILLWISYHQIWKDVEH